MIKTIGFILGFLVISAASSSSATTVKQEPPWERCVKGKSCWWTMVPVRLAKSKGWSAATTPRWAGQSKSSERAVASHAECSRLGSRGGIGSHHSLDSVVACWPRVSNRNN